MPVPFHRYRYHLATQVKLFRRNSLACHGHLIDESWLITSAECFGAANGTEPTSGAAEAEDWSAEIIYEHYGTNEDHQFVEPNGRRSVKEIHRRLMDDQNGLGSSPSSSSAIVLVRLDRPVRFR